MGIDAVHLLTACVMSAPASLIISRMLFPETKKSKFMKAKSLALTSGTENNMVEAAAVGASTSIGLVANIAANIIGFIALLKFVNSVLMWFGSFVKINLSFDVICGYLFTPVAFLLGADWSDCFTVGKLFGIKTFLNEFIGYNDLAQIVHGTYLNGTVAISERSEVVAIHALCGFCNVSSLGIIVGGLSVLMPNRIGELAKLALRALFGGVLTCCMTACVAGLLFQESAIAEVVSNSTMVTTDGNQI
jgi:pyrimidine nucleoside transport protein